MVHYGPSENQKFAIPIKPENFDLIIFMNFGTPPAWMVASAYLDGKHYYTFRVFFTAYNETTSIPKGAP
jgi:hypothetical protein